MPDPTTTNLVLAQPIRGTDTGTWDIPVNGNTGIIDQAFGGVTTLALSSAGVVLTASQAQSSIIRLTGALTASVQIFLPSIYKFWTIDNQIVNSPSSFCASLISTTSSGQGIGLPPGTTDIFYDGAAINFRNLGNVGQYWDYTGIQVPTWVNTCTKAPYLNCNGTTFSSATYPILANLLGSNVLPDSRGRARFGLNQGVGILTTAGAGIDGNTLFATGGSNGINLGSSHIPSHTVNGTITVNPGGSTAIFFPVGNSANVFNGSFNIGNPGGAGNILAAINGAWTQSFQASGVNSMAYTNASQAIVASPIPGYAGGITMIRAA